MNSERLVDIFAKMRRKLQRTANSIIGDEDEAEDAVQDVFCALWSKRSDMQDDTSVEKILSKSLRNRCISALRFRSRYQSVDSETTSEKTKSFNGSEFMSEAETEDSESLFKEVERVIASSLSDRDREILMLRDHAGWEYEEIAEKFDMTPASVRMALSRGRKRVLEVYRERNNNKNR